MWYLWLCILTCYLRATAEELLKEYKACESADYITYVGPLSVPSMLDDHIPSRAHRKKGHELSASIVPVSLSCFTSTQTSCLSWKKYIVR